jgi:hypothetical protein
VTDRFRLGGIGAAQRLVFVHRHVLCLANQVAATVAPREPDGVVAEGLGEHD